MIKRAIAISFIFLASCTSVSQAEVKQADKPILLHADDMVFDQKNNTIKATGNVQAYQEKEALTTDSLFYDRGLGKITADGHVAWQMSNGDVYFGSHAVMQNQMKDASINNFRGLLIDESRLAANHGVRRNGTETQMDQAVYSPCRVCRETPDKAPLWQIKAESVLIDEEAQDIIYTDAWMEIIGVPVLYTPYFRHPTPSVKQRSGILTPRLNVSKELGFYYVQPYYHVISPDKDITIEPLITKKKGAILSAEYRQRFSNANLRLGGSGGPSKRKVEKEKNKVKNKKYEDAWRGHIDSSLEWDVNENWRISANALGANDKTYLRLFPFYGHVHDNVLTSQAKAEGFYGLNYVRVQGYAYQGLRKEDKQKTIPLVAPIIDLNYVSPEQFWGSRFYVDANSLVLTRRKGTDVQRLSTTVSWKLPFVTALGDKYALSFRLRGDGYNRQEFKPHQHESRKKHSMHEMNGAQGRVFPQSVLEWEYPWINASSSGHVIISPMASLIVAPKLSNQRNIPNEDCEFIEPNDEYILTHSRFPGLDRIDDGSRINYGLKMDTRLSTGIKSGAFLGRTSSFEKPNDAFKGTGFEKMSSDYLGRINLTLFDYFDARYRFRLSRSEFKILRNELTSSAGVPIFKVTANYVKLPHTEKLKNKQHANQITLGLSSAFATGWSASLATTRDLGKREKTEHKKNKVPRSLVNTAALNYENECIGLGFVFTHTFVKAGEVKPGKGFMFILTFKTLGGEVLHKTSIKSSLGGNDSGAKQSGLFGNVL